MCAADNEDDLETNLCYQALGVSHSDSPQRINEVYEYLVREAKTEFGSADPNVRESARDQLVTIEKMYNTIIASVSYASSANAHRKKASGTSNVTDATVRSNTAELMTCPSCQTQMTKGLQSCPYCKASFLTGWQKFRYKYFR